ncbi:FecR domain-containing protein [Pseudomonas citronellolis]|uniref:FecR domain-containing protein n=1 Tax=Pseudomonas citronellolis TaxID=53408 RepID=UPI0023E407F9|nr:FecR domain-containing protein [Pseudomonas citronellolis]MDF3933985.1 FecR domain-containing protein [Pseudomonas citronellolis]
MSRAEAEARLLEEAADWVLTLRFDAPDAAQRQAFERWRGQSDAHREAWSRAERVFGTFDAVPTEVGRRTLQRLDGLSRRRALRLLGTLLMAAPAGWLVARSSPWESWMADARTATGERKALTLADGSQVVLNTGSALDIGFDAKARRLRLRDGEVLITTHPDSVAPRRPFLVAAEQGVVEALGTRFSVRQLGGQCLVAVFEHAVEIRPQAGPALRLAAGRQAWFDARGVLRSAPVDDSAALWEQGMLVARDQPLAEVLAELARYRHGLLRCDPEVAGLRVSGALSVADTDQALSALELTLPVRVTRMSRYWVNVAAR